jgi:hypothetical protein
VDDDRIVVDVDMGYFILTNFIGYFVIGVDFIADFDLADRDSDPSVKVVDCFVLYELL